MRDVWIWLQLRDGVVEDGSGGLIAEARRLAAAHPPEGKVTAVLMGSAPQETLALLGNYGVDRVFHFCSREMNRYEEELFSLALADCIRRDMPACLLMIQSAVSDDLGQRLAAILETALVRRTLDFTIIDEKQALAMRPVAGGYLFEEVRVAMTPPPIITFRPSVLFDVEPDRTTLVEVTQMAPEVSKSPGTVLLEVIEAAPEDLDLDEADVIVSGGRGMGKGDAFSMIHDLARTIGGSVGGTRPIIDWGILPYARQIGQTGKYVSPRLIINCGISGANEYTAGMEKAQHVIAIDTNPRARIFRYADLGLVGDVHGILPLLIERLAAIRKNKKALVENSDPKSAESSEKPS